MVVRARREYLGRSAYKFYARTRFPERNLIFLKPGVFAPCLWALKSLFFGVTLGFLGLSLEIRLRSFRFFGGLRWGGSVDTERKLI